MMAKRTAAVGITCVLLSAVLGAVSEANADEKMMKLKLELPKPMLRGTPKNIKAANLEKPGTKRKPVIVPQDVQNVALEKPVNSSDDEPIIGDLEQITDGDKEGADGSFVELGPDVQWVQIDLEAEYEVYAIAVWHYYSQARVYHDVVVQCADDPDFIENVKTLFSNDHDNSAGLGVGKAKAYIETNQGYVVNAKGVKTRYIRLYSNGNTSNDMNHYIEVEVFGRPVK